jgi:hypothetical protein
VILFHYLKPKFQRPIEKISRNRRGRVKKCVQVQATYNLVRGFANFSPSHVLILLRQSREFTASRSNFGCISSFSSSSPASALSISLKTSSHWRSSFSFDCSCFFLMGTKAILSRSTSSSRTSSSTTNEPIPTFSGYLAFFIHNLTRKNKPFLIDSIQ